MPDILHRVSIDAPTQRVHDLIAATDGIARWWTGRPLDGNGARFGVYFGDSDKPAAVMQVVADQPDEITWRVEEGPDSWIGTLVMFTIRPHGADGTTLLFTHAGWPDASEFMSGCSTNWAPTSPASRPGPRAVSSPLTHMARSAAGARAV